MLIKRSFKELISLFKKSEREFLNNYAIIKSEGSWLEVINDIKSIQNHGYFTKTVKTELKKVLLNEIAWTDHPSYQEYWDAQNSKFLSKKFIGQREPPIDGTLTGWEPRKNTQEQHICLTKHPDRNQYSITGDGNNRVMKSLTTPNSADFVWAIVDTTKWNEVADSLIHFLNELRPFHFYLRAYRDQISLGIMLYKDSRVFYIERIPVTDIGNVIQIYRGHELEVSISSWEYQSFKTRISTIYKLFLILLKSPYI